MPPTLLKREKKEDVCMNVGAKMEYVLKEGGTFERKVIGREAEGRPMGVKESEKGANVGLKRNPRSTLRNMENKLKMNFVDNIF